MNWGGNRYHSTARKTYYRLLFAVIILFVLFISIPLYSLPITLKDYQLKAVYLYKFSYFVRWPDAAFNHGNQLNLCLMGDSPIKDQLSTAIKNEKVFGRTINFMPIKRLEKTAKCHILYISELETYRYPAILAFLKNKPVLTVSSVKGFIDNGGIIEFYIRNHKIHFKISPVNAKAKQIDISSNLLSVATVIEGKKE